MHQNSLHLIIPGMTYGHPAGSSITSHFSKEVIAQIPSSFFNGAISFATVISYISFTNNDWNVKRGSQISHILGIRIRFRPSELMIKMSRMKFYVKFILPFCQDMQQTNRVSAT